MRAIVLAAGRGNRLRPLTDSTPKPMLPVGNHRLMDWQLCALKKAGITEIVINTAHLADAFETLPQLLQEKGMHAVISREGNSAEDALESLGGIVKALPLLTGDDPEAPFIVAAGDVVHDYPMKRLVALEQAIRDGRLDGHLVAVPNPSFHANGDMTVHEDGTITPGNGPHTYGCLMVVSPRIFAGLPPVLSKLFPWLWQFAASGRLTAEVWNGFWGNIGSPMEYEWLCNHPEAQTCLEE